MLGSTSSSRGVNDSVLIRAAVIIFRDTEGNDMMT